MKKIIHWLPNWIILPIFLLLFLATWPLLLIGVGVKALFSEGSLDSEKIAGAKAAILCLVGLITVALFAVYQRPLINFFDNFPWRFLFVSVLIGLFVLIFLQRTFPNWKWPKKDSNLA